MNRGNADRADEILRILEERGISFFTDAPDPSKGSGIANTCILRHRGRTFVIDTACGPVRVRQIKDELKEGEVFDILCTHYHNDHMANTGKVASQGTSVFCHHNLKKKIRYLRTNFTGQMLVMARDMDLEGMLKRFAVFPPPVVRLLVVLSRVSIRIPQFFVFMVCYFFSWKTMGRITVPRRAVRYFEPGSMIELADAGKISGWEIMPGLVALETPGHTDCHISFYHPETRTLFAGDSLNFLNPNDIQFGDPASTRSTLKFLRGFVEREKVELVLTGHNYPLYGNENILALIDEVEKRYDHVCSAVRNVIGSRPVVRFQEMVDRVWSLDDPLMKKLVRISFPRSTLIFLDVFILFILKEAGYARDRDGLWRRHEPVMDRVDLHGGGYAG